MEQIIFETPWIKVKRTPRGFDYLERKGCDSVAILLTRWNQTVNDLEILIRWQPLCVHNADIDREQRLYPCPVTGGMDGNESPIECALRETYEETGYKLEKLNLLTKYIASTQSNESVYLFWGDASGLVDSVGIQDGSYFESISRNEWKPLEFLRTCEYIGCQLGYFLVRSKIVEKLG